jgi:hypothetical protein
MGRTAGHVIVGVYENLTQHLVIADVPTLSMGVTQERMEFPVSFRARKGEKLSANRAR